jgi:oligopeptide transport system substrate-binding protein
MPCVRALLLNASLLISALTCQHALAATLERGNGPEPDSLDPQRAQGLAAHTILRDLFEGLTRINAKGEVEAGVALHWAHSADQLSWRFALDPKAAYSDGSRLTAHDFVFALQRAVDPKTAAPYASQLDAITGARERLRGDAKAALGVLAIDDVTLEIKLREPNAALPLILSLAVAAPVQQRCFTEHAERCVRAGQLVSNGAYKLVQWRPLGFVQLEKNPHYRQRDQVKIAQVRFHVTEDASEEARRFSAGELHMTESVPPGRLAQLREKFGAQLHIAPSLGSFFLAFNHERPPFKDNPALREALSLAIDRKRIVESITGTGELQAFGLLPPALLPDMQWQALQPRTSQSEREALAKAKYAQAILQAQRLYAPGSAGYFSESAPLTLELRFNTSLLHRRLMLALALMWEQTLGVKTVLRNEEWKVFVQNRRAKRNTQVFRGGWNADLADPMNFLALFESQSALNYSGFRSTQYDAALRQLAQAESFPDRLAKAAQAELILRERHALLPIYHYTSKHLISPKLRGFYANPLDIHPSQTLFFAP